MKKMIKTLPALALLTLLTGCVVYVGGDTATADQHIEKELTLDSQNLTELIADTTAGNIRVVGVDNTDKIHVKADIYTNEELEYTLSLTRQGNKAKLVADHDVQDGLVFHINQGLSIDLVITMPKDLMLELDDSSGDIVIEGLSNDIHIEDGSGDLSLNGGRSVFIDDGSGDINIQNVKENLSVDDGSGDIRIHNVNGFVEVSDSSGNLTVKNVSKHVKIDDGSGDITVQTAGSLIIEEDGSGSLNVDDIQGEVTIK